ncbi:MAG: response regulator [Polyangiaceae bacterium]
MSERIHEPKPRILVVDDDANNRALMRFYLREFTSDIVEAETGMDAVRLVEADAFDLVLLDVMMPGMDGFAATRRIRQVRRNDGLPIVLVTAFGHREARIQALESGADEYLEKPFVAREFRARVDNLLRVRSHARHHAARTAELETLSAFKEEMSALVVHDLKSPLASLTTNLSVVQSVLARGDGPNPVLDALADCQSSATTLRRRIGNLLDIARCESGALIASRTPVSVAS